jgi:phosphate transport system substrate-binding protein
MTGHYHDSREVSLNMKRCLLLSGLIILTMISLSGFAHTITATEQKTANLIVAGSGTCISVVSKLAKAFNLKAATKITVPESIDSNGAIKAVKEGSLYLGLTSRPLKDIEKNAGLTEIPFAKVGVIFGVHPDVPDTNLTGSDLVAIFNGNKTKWQNGRTIIVLTREEGDSTINLLQKKVAGFYAAYTTAMYQKKWVVCFTVQEEAQAIAQTKNSFGFSDTGTLSVFHYKIKALRFNQVEPTLANIKNAKYPFSKDLYFIYKGDNLTEAAQDFIIFTKSPRGQKILEKSGALPWED